ncbi:high mobility group B protein 14-like [Bidens hawaiensis]|uniref:high mobility group B protein 14-like n=1 Tax=Bidens hawaiensis TaxID=980011 RepID=UPI00404AF6E4
MVLVLHYGCKRAQLGTLHPWEDFRKEFQEQNPNVKSMREIGKACGDKWKIMTYEEKVQYHDIATEKRAKFEKALADYVKKQENGEYDKSDDDSDYDA